MSYDQKRVGQAIERVQKREGLSTNAWAKKAGMSEAGLRDIISGRIKSPGLDKIYRLAAAADVPVWDLLGEEVPWKAEYEALMEIFESIYAQDSERTAAMEKVISAKARAKRGPGH